MNKLANKKGFTLVEVLIATAIIVLAVSGATALEKGNINVGSYSKHAIEAKSLGLQASDLVRRYSDLAKQEGSTVDDPADENEYVPGVYYLNENDQLQKCTSFMDTEGAVVPTEPEAASLLTTDVICKQGKKTIGTDFYTTIIIPPYE